MSVSGLAGTVRGCLLRTQDPLSLRRHRGLVVLYGRSREDGSRSRNVRSGYVVRSAMDASFGDMAGNFDVFPRIYVRDPYKRLGISNEASEEEIQAARIFLMKKYVGHKPSLDAIESAHDQIITQKFNERRNPKIDIKKKVTEVQSRFLEFFANRFKTPSTKIMLQSFVAFLVIGLFTVLFPAEDGPTLQVAMSFIANVYFIYNRLQSKFRAFFYGALSFFLCWMIGTFLMITVIPPVLKGLRAFEVTTSLITYVLLWFSSTCLI